jgi:hypothetical protein
MDGNYRIENKAMPQNLLSHEGIKPMGISGVIYTTLCIHNPPVALFVLV